MGYEWMMDLEGTRGNARQDILVEMQAIFGETLVVRQDDTRYEIPSQKAAS